MAAEPTVGQRLAAPAAITSMVGAVGWFGGALLSRGLVSPLAIAGVCVGALLVGGFVYWWMQRLVAVVLGPLYQITRALREAASRPRDNIAVLSRLLIAVPSPTSIEQRELVDAVTFMLRRIEERQRRQAAWAAALVHDIKTPVAAAANGLEPLSSDARTWTGDDRALVRSVALELRSLASHVQQLLDAMSLEREDVKLELTEVDLGLVVRQILEGTRCRDGVTVRWSGGGIALADVRLLTRAIENLVENACRYARSRLQIDVFHGLLRVEDDGPGLPAPLEVLTEPFRSESLEFASEVLHGGAAGMGLFLARRVLELHEGKLVVERSDSAGTVFLAYVGRARGHQHAR
jgi:signal transduction histidine kinase